MSTPGHEPAFPGHENSGYSGMTMREWFAGVALQGMLASPNRKLKNGDTPSDVAGIAETAFILADAMLAESKKDKVPS